MAITLSNVTLTEEQGFNPNAPTSVVRISFTGDAAYLAGGSAGFETAVAQALGRHAVEITSVQGYGLTAAAITHTVRWDQAAGKLIAYVLATGAEVAPGDNSAVTYDLTLICR